MRPSCQSTRTTFIAFSLPFSPMNSLVETAKSRSATLFVRRRGAQLHGQ
jgi:hypothetical protein